MSAEAIEIEALDQPSFTQVGHWVAFRSDLSPTARHLYTVLAAFVNQRRRSNGDTDVWPSLNLLAVTLGLSQGDSVTPYIDELIQAGIVVKTAHDIGGMKARNHYAIRFNPPPGTKVVTSFAELLEPLKAIAGDTKAMSEAAKATRSLIKERRERESAPRSTGKAKVRPVPRNTGVRAPESRGTHPGKPGRNNTQGELDEGSNVDESSSSAGAAAEPAPKKTKKTPEQIIQERTDATAEEAKAVVDHIEQQGTGTGQPIRSLARWVEGRDDRDLARDLAHVRAPQTAAGGRYEDDPGAYLRRMNNAHKSYVGGTRGPTITQEEAAELAEMTQDQLRDTLLGAAPPKPRARVPAYTPYRNPTDTSRYNEEF